METIHAIQLMASAEAAGLEGSRTPGAIALHRKSESIHLATNKAIILISANRLNPEDDRATQVRLASAVDRQIAGASTGPQDTASTTRAIMFDVLMQEAAARHLQAEGQKDPLDHIAFYQSDREGLNASEMLDRHGIAAGAIFKRATPEDLKAIAAGRYDQIEGENTRFAISAILRLDEKQISMQTRDIPEQEAVRPRPDYSRFPSTGLGAGPRATPPVAFGRKVSAER